MKALLLKEWYTTLKYGKGILVFMSLFILFGPLLFRAEGMFVQIYPCMAAGLIPATLISYDEKNGWNRYWQIFPYSYAQIVSAKYVMSLLLLFIAVSATMVSQTFWTVLGGGLPEINWLWTSLILLTASFLPPVISFPVIFRFGSGKGNLLYYVEIIVICAFTIWLGEQDVSGLAFILPYFRFLLPVGACLLLAGSWLLSIRLYRKTCYR